MVNQLPQGWKEDRIDNLSYKILSGGTPNRSISSYYGGNIPWVKTGEVQDCVIYDTEETITEEGLKNSSAKVFPKGTLLVALYGATAAKLAILAIDAATNQACCGIQVDESKILMKYIYYYLLGQRSNLLALTSGAGQQNLNVGKIKNYYISYPTDKDEQDYIVKTLDAVAEMIKLRKETIQLTKDLIPAIFQEMFGNIRGSEPIKKHVIVNPRKVSLNDDVEVSFFSMADVSVDGYILSSQRRRYSDVRNGFSSFMNDDVILAKITPCYENGKGAIVRDLINGIGFGSTEFYVLRCDKQYILPEYLFYLLRSDDFMELGKCHMKGAAGQKRLDKSFLQNFGIVYPPLPLQKEFADKVEQINQNLKIQQEDLDRLEELFDQLLQKAFTGELTRGEDYGKH